MQTLKEDATLEEQVEYYREYAINFVIHYTNLRSRYEKDTTMLMFFISEYVPNFEDMLRDAGLTEVLENFKKNRSLENGLKDYNVPTSGGEL